MLAPLKAKQLIALVTNERWADFEAELDAKKKMAERRLSTEDKTVEIYRLQGRIKMLEELLNFKTNTMRDAKLDA